jgi:hypothetical protein
MVTGRASKRRNLYTHLTALVVVPGCVALCWWQVTRALSGNSLSWAYVFEWPIFGGYAVFMWWKGAEEDEELASYNRYLAALHDSGRRKHW